MAAGIVWERLREKGRLTFSELKCVRSGRACDEIVAAVGWLAREGRLTFRNRGRASYIELVEEELYVS